MSVWTTVGNPVTLPTNSGAPQRSRTVFVAAVKNPTVWRFVNAAASAISSAEPGCTNRSTLPSPGSDGKATKSAMSVVLASALTESLQIDRPKPDAFHAASISASIEIAVLLYSYAPVKLVLGPPAPPVRPILNMTRCQPDVIVALPKHTWFRPCLLMISLPSMNKRPRDMTFDAKRHLPASEGEQ